MSRRNQERAEEKETIYIPPRGTITLNVCVIRLSATTVEWPFASQNGQQQQRRIAAYKCSL